MSTFSSDNAEREHLDLWAQLQRRQEDVILLSSEINILQLEIVRKQGQLFASRQNLVRCDAQLHELAQKLGLKR